jgi:hypothetical protein
MRGEKYNRTGAIMLRGKFRTLGALSALAIGLSACASPVDIQRMYSYRWGADPAMPADHIDAVIHDQALVIRYIEDNAPILPPIGSPLHYYEVALWGFNVGRQDCEIYMNVLFKINRQKLQNANVITAFSTAATTVVGVAGSSPSTTMSILAASFGLLSALNNAYFDTYLFSQVPGLVAKKVLDAQETYRSSFKPADIITPADAYHVIRNYYQMCLPETIEGTLLESVAGLTPRSDAPLTNNSGSAAGAPSGPARAAAAAKLGPSVRPTPTPARINTFQ